MNEDLYKMLYEASVKEAKKSQKEFFKYVLQTLEADLGTNFYDFLDFVVLEMLKSLVETVEDSNNDIWETPDNKARDLSSAYRMVEYFSTAQEYQEYVQVRRDEANETS